MKDCVFLPAVGKQNATYSPDFTQPGKSLLEIPCRVGEEVKETEREGKERRQEANIEMVLSPPERILYSQFRKKSYKVSASPIMTFRQPAKMGGKRNMEVPWIETL